MRMLYLPLTILAVLAAGQDRVSADDLLPPTQPIDQVVDHYIDQKLKEDDLKPAGPADDATLIRRLTLDLVGRIPTVPETKAYVESTDPDKKARLVDRLMTSPAFVRHLANELDAMLMPGSRTSLRDYLQKALAAGRNWDVIYRDIMLPDEKDPAQKGASEFVRGRVADLDKLTADVSSLFFGVNVSCARCHDHPLVQDWKQDHFFGMKSFFNRTFDNGGFLGEREVGLVKFKTTKGVEKKARLMFLTGKVVEDATVREQTGDEMKREREVFESHKKNKTQPPTPKVSARKFLVDLSLQPDQQSYFARSIVNRTWYRLFSRGLVMPLDQMHTENPPSHPELLDWLARDTAANGYNLRRLIRGLVLSRTYARSSHWSSEELPRANMFAVARVRALTPMQMAASLRLATADPVGFQGKKAEEIEKTLEGLEANARGMASMFEQPNEDFQIGVSEALLFSNSDRITKELLTDGGDRLLGRLKLGKDVKENIDLAVRSTLCRPAQPEEAKAMEQYLQQRQDRTVEAYRQLVWALLASAEFRFNH
jgi:Protein of unknown function (DUF1549)/Protein of unknown function (DUF1553)